MITPFTYHSDPVRIVFGAGAVGALRAETEFHKISRLVVLCSPTRADFARQIIAPVADRCVGFCDTAGQHALVVLLVVAFGQIDNEVASLKEEAKDQ